MEPSLGLRPNDLSVPEFLAKEHAFKVWVASFDGLKAVTLGSSYNAVGSPDNTWESVELSMLNSVLKANKTFKTPKKLRSGPMYQPQHVPFTPRSKREPLIKLEALGESLADKDRNQQIKYGLDPLWPIRSQF